MVKPRAKFRERPKKTGAKKRQKVLSQEKRLIDAGYDKASLDKMSTVDIRELLKKITRKKGPKA